MNSKLKQILFNRPAFYISLIVITIFIVGLLAYGQCNPEPLPSAKEITEDVSYNNPTMFPTYIYVVDEFSPNQIAAMKSALLDWNKKTKGIFYVELIENWAAPKDFDPAFYEFYDKITLWNRNVNDINYAYLAYQHTFFSGAVKGSMIVMTDDKEYTDREFEIIFKHEVGHIAGLGHLKTEYPGLMHIGGNQGFISKYDLILFCNTYECLPGTIE